MKTLRVIPIVVLILVMQTNQAFSQQNYHLAENSALRYWTAFSEMQDSAIGDEQAKEMNAVLDGASPYDDSKYKDLIEKNRFALETMERGTKIPICDWGLDYALGPETPVGYVWKARALGSLNVLYSFHLLIAGDKDATVKALAAGLRFSHDVANGGSLVSALVAKRLLLAHFVVLTSVNAAGLSPAQRAILQKAVGQLGPEGLDWPATLKREMDILAKADPQDSAALAPIVQAYLKALDSPSTLPALEKLQSNAPQRLSALIPSAKRMLEQKQGLSEKLVQIHSSLQ
jgi:hypothetical protein